MSEEPKKQPPKKTKVALKKDHTHAGVAYKLEKDKEPPQIEVTEKQAAWLKERGII